MPTRRSALAAGVLASTSFVGVTGKLGAQDDFDYGDFAPPDLRLTLRLLNVAGDEADESLIERMIAVLTDRAEQLGATSVHIERLAGSDIILSVRDTGDIELTIATLSRRGLMEVIDPQGAFLEPVTVVTTSFGGPLASLGTSVPATPGPSYETILSSVDVEHAFPSLDPLGGTVVFIRLTKVAGESFREFTEANIGNPMAIVVDNVVVIAPVIQAQIGNEVIIRGLTDDEVNALVIHFSTEPLRGRIELLEVDSRG